MICLSLGSIYLALGLVGSSSGRWFKMALDSRSKLKSLS